MFFGRVRLLPSFLTNMFFVLISLLAGSQETIWKGLCAIEFLLRFIDWEEQLLLENEQQTINIYKYIIVLADQD